jgi:hypothetical protein
LSLGGDSPHQLSDTNKGIIELGGFMKVISHRRARALGAAALLEQN